MKTLSVGAKTLLLLGVLGALSILVRMLLPDEIGAAAVTILGCVFAAWVVYLISNFVSHRREPAPPEEERAVERASLGGHLGVHPGSGELRALLILAGYGALLVRGRHRGGGLASALRLEAHTVGFEPVPSHRRLAARIPSPSKLVICCYGRRRFSPAPAILKR